MLNIKENLLTKDTKDYHQRNFTKSPNSHHETKGKLLVFLAYTLMGSMNFGIKFTKNYFGQNFDLLSFVFWRATVLVAICAFTFYLKNERPLDYFKVEKRFWFTLRTCGNFFSMMFLILSLDYIRISTASCISSMNPALVIIFAIFILGEKFHRRFVLGFAFCFVGALMIISNEKSVEEVDVRTKEVHTKQSTEILTGAFLALVHVTFVSLILVSSKIMINDKMSFKNQCFYMGLSNIVLCSVSLCFFGSFNCEPTFVFFSLVSGVFHYGGMRCMNLGFKRVEVSKVSIFSYVATLVVFVLDVMIIGEPVLFTDILGSLMIMSFSVYNSLKPIKN